MFRRARERRVWRGAFHRLTFLRSDREELREALTHLGLSYYLCVESIMEVRAACGPHWFDRNYPHLWSKK